MSQRSRSALTPSPLFWIDMGSMLFMAAAMWLQGAPEWALILVLVIGTRPSRIEHTADHSRLADELLDGVDGRAQADPGRAPKV